MHDIFLIYAARSRGSGVDDGGYRRRRSHPPNRRECYFLQDGKTGVNGRLHSFRRLSGFVTICVRNGFLHIAHRVVDGDDIRKLEECGCRIILVRPPKPSSRALWMASQVYNLILFLAKCRFAAGAAARKFFQIPGAVQRKVPPGFTSCTDVIFFPYGRSVACH